MIRTKTEPHFLKERNVPVVVELTSGLLNLLYDMFQLFLKHAHVYQTNDLTKTGHF